MMRLYSALSIFALLLFSHMHASVWPSAILRACWNKQVKPLQDGYLVFDYTETRNELTHNTDPWQQSHYTGRGKVWCKATQFLRQDTLTTGKRMYTSKVQLSGDTLTFLDYGDKEVSVITESLYAEQLFSTARYYPGILLSRLAKAKLKPGRQSTREMAVFTTTIHKIIVTLYIRVADQLLEKITLQQHDDLHGDVTTSFLYTNYTSVQGLSFAQSVRIEKINGRVIDEVMISSPDRVSSISPLLEKPTEYTIAADQIITPKINVVRHSEHLSFIEMEHTEDRVLVVEFSDFMLVAEAPLSSENGELILAEVKKLAPDKPVRYFVFGHHHPHYLGGIRPFIHRGVTVISRSSNLEYLHYLSTAPHTLQPDSQQLHSRPLQTEVVEESKTISDGVYEMQIYFIGKRSEHTNDYLVYYFPKEKLLFEDDLLWIMQEGELKKAGPRQVGLYNAIKELGLEVATIIQSWPVSGYGVKTIIPFEELERTISVK